MRLSDSVYQDVLLAALGDEELARRHAGATRWHEARAESDRRRTPRQKLSAGNASCRRYGLVCAALQPVELRDVSAGGAGLVVPDLVFAPGEQLVLYPPGWLKEPSRRGREAPAPAGILSTVRSVRLLMGGRVHLGAEFTAPAEPAPADRVAAARSRLGGRDESAGATAGLTDTPALRHDAHDASGVATRRQLCGEGAVRVEPRRPLRAWAEMYVLRADGSSGPVERSEVVNASAGGLGLLRAEPLQPGDEFVIRVPRVDEPPVTWFCRVTRAEYTGGRWLIGAGFALFGRRRGRSLLMRVLDWIA